MSSKAGASKIVATSHPLATAAALDAWRGGGNAVDAAVAASAILAVVDPRSTGIGGDLFAQVWPAGAGSPRGLSAAGPAPAGLSMDTLKAAGFRNMPDSGPWAVTVPGSVAGWHELITRYGNLDLERLLQPATLAAVEGTPVPQFIAEEWAGCLSKLQANEESARSFLLSGRPPKEGEVFANPALGEALSRIGAEGPDVFYRGELGQKIGRAIEALGGPLDAEDLSSWVGPEWVEPIKTGYRGVEVYEMPPPGQGLVTLQALAIYKGFSPTDPTDADHLAIESMKLAFADARLFISDPAFNEVPLEELLSDGYTASRRGLIVPDRVSSAQAGTPSDTVYVAAADEEISCSLIHSLYESFGSGVTVPGTGIALQNRGAGFVMEEGHVNRPEPRKRPYHTIIPAMLGDARGFLGCLGVVGGFMQPQGQFQLIRNIVDREMPIAEAVAAPRFRVITGNKVAFEAAYDKGIVSGLLDRGHDVSELSRFEAGGAQMVMRMDNGFAGASDPRKDGCVGGI
jgi:gamma-glutamyltranspeptidase / glutathione hydrolase